MIQGERNGYQVCDSMVDIYIHLYIYTVKSHEMDSLLKKKKKILMGFLHMHIIPGILRGNL